MEIKSRVLTGKNIPLKPCYLFTSVNPARADGFVAGLRRAGSVYRNLHSTTNPTRRYMQLSAPNGFAPVPENRTRVITTLAPCDDPDEGLRVIFPAV